MDSLPHPYKALIIGASGGIGSALTAAISTDPHCALCLGLSRTSTPALDLRDENSIATALTKIADQGPFNLIFISTGALTINGRGPEKKLGDLSADQLAAAFAINTIGPALILRHITPLLPRQERALIGILSARVGSISDNRSGGWYSYRASKAALNMLIRTSAIELARKYPDLVISALHPGTVSTSLSSPYVSNHTQFEPAQAATYLLSVMDHLTPADTGTFSAWDGQKIEW
jgi:NAD(P)-dependent dehydrogenase (short-subunit alcohol dehydrogenase family)